jgi:uncharacterized membrane protein (DUF106 family)
LEELQNIEKTLLTEQESLRDYIKNLKADKENIEKTLLTEQESLRDYIKNLKADKENIEIEVKNLKIKNDENLIKSFFIIIILFAFFCLIYPNRGKKVTKKRI